MVNRASDRQLPHGPTVAKEKSTSNRGSTSGITGVQRETAAGERSETMRERESPAGSKVREEGGVGPPSLLRVGGGIANWE